MYKLVENVGNRLYSCWAGGTLRTEYIPKEWIIGKCGLNLMVFATMSDLAKFYHTFPKGNNIFYQLEIWKCSVINPKDHGYFVTDLHYYTSLCNSSKNKLLSAIKNNSSQKAPKGTVFCENVMLTEKLPSIYHKSYKLI